MGPFRRKYAISRVISKAASWLSVAIYGAFHTFSLVFGRQFQSMLSLWIHKRSIVVLTVRGVRFACETPYYYMRAKFTYEKERETLGWIDGFPPESTLWDIGANVGCFSLYAAQRGHCVVAFEPHPANYAALAINIQLNGLSERVMALSVALYRQEKISTLSAIDIDAGAAMSVFDSPAIAPAAASSSPFQFSAISFRPDEFVAQFNPPLPDYIKLDVDGNEWDILEGAPQVLANLKLRSVMVEMNRSQADYQPIEAQLARHGFQVVNRYSHGQIENVLFARN